MPSPPSWWASPSRPRSPAGALHPPGRPSIGEQLQFDVPATALKTGRRRDEVRLSKAIEPGDEQFAATGTRGGRIRFADGRACAMRHCGRYHSRILVSMYSSPCGPGSSRMISAWLSQGLDIATWRTCSRPSAPALGHHPAVERAAVLHRVLPLRLAWIPAFPCRSR